MSIGLYDVDFFKYHQVMFNLEIMKLASYFKNKREITVLSPTFSPEKYSKFFLRKDFYDGTFPSGLRNANNLDYGGLAFTGNIYIPLDEDIERCKPDTHVYDRYQDLFKGTVKNHIAAYTSLVNNAHLRLSLDGENIWEGFEKQISSAEKYNILFFHDYDLGSIKDAAETVEYLLKKYSKIRDSHANLAAKFPIQCATYSEFEKWNKFVFNENFLTMQINQIMSDEELSDLMAKTSQAKSQRIKYRIADASSDKNDFIEKVLPKIFKQVIFCCNNHKQILLTIDDNFKIEETWRQLITLFNLYMSAAKSYTRVPALYKFCKSLKLKEDMYQTGIMCREEAQQIFLFVLEKDPELFKMFYECNKVHLEGGEFKID